MPGGQGTSWRVGQAVFKPLDGDPELLPWEAELLGRLDGREDFRVSAPLHTADGSWHLDGWTARRFQPGAHQPGRWLDIIDAGRRFHAAVAAAGEVVPLGVRERRDNWAIADKVAWGDLPAAPYLGVKHLPELMRALRPVEGRPQLVHGDLTGNVLFADQLPPLVIDLAPYWRPPEYASAIVVVDALTYESAGRELVEPLLAHPELPQYLLRAFIYRIVTDHLFWPDVRRRDDDDPYLPPVRLALDLARAR